MNISIKEMLLEMHAKRLNYNLMSRLIRDECIKNGGDKGLTGRRLAQIANDNKMGNSAGIYERAITNLYKRICK